MMVMKCVGHVACMGEMRKAHNFCRKPEEKKQMWRSRIKWEDNIKVILKEWGMKMRTRFFWLMIGSNGTLL
jgi:hypothetical protein